MNEKQFDNIIKNSIDRYGSPVSTEMWDRISPKGKKRRFFVWWWILPGAAILTGLYFSGVFERQEIKSKALVAVTENKNNNSNTTPNNPANSVPFKSKTHIQKQTNSYQIKLTNHPHEAADHLSLPAEQLAAENENNITDQAPATRELNRHSIPNTASFYKKPSINLKVSYTDMASHEQRERIAKKLNPWFAEIYTGPAVALKTTDRYFHSYNKNSRLSIHSGILIGKYLSKKIYLKTGVTYTSIREKFEFDSITLSKRNSYNAFDIPLIVGYALIDQKLKVNLQVGVLYNFYSWRRDFVSPESYKKTGWRVLASANILYPVGEKLQLKIEPYYIRQLTNMSRYDSYNLKIQQIGLSAGVRYTIPNRQHH